MSGPVKVEGQWGRIYIIDNSDASEAPAGP